MTIKKCFYVTCDFSDNFNVDENKLKTLDKESNPGLYYQFTSLDNTAHSYGEYKDCLCSYEVFFNSQNKKDLKAKMDLLGWAKRDSLILCKECFSFLEKVNSLDKSIIKRKTDL